MEYLLKKCGRFGVVLSVFILLGANFVAAQELTVSGEVLVGYGWVNLESTTLETSGPDGVGEAVLNFAAKKGAFSAQIELEVDDSTQLEVAEHEIVWAVSDKLSITISGQSFGIESAADNTSVINAPAGQIGDEGEELDFGDTGILNVEFAVGEFTIGLALLDSCIPECGYAGLDADDEQVYSSDSERSTTVFHLRGKAGPLNINAYAASSEGGFNTGTELESGGGSGAGFGILFESAAFTVGFDASSSTVECATSAKSLPDIVAGTACAEDVETTNFGLAATFGGFGIHYFSGEESVGSSTTEVINIDVVYTFSVGDATIGPEYRIKTTDTGGTSITDSFLVFGMSLEF